MNGRTPNSRSGQRRLSRKVGAEKVDRESSVWLIAGKYEVVREIGRGGTASVYEATNRWSRRRVTDKIT